MNEYFDSIDYVSKVRLSYKDTPYIGRGTLKWRPGEGFHFDAILDRQGPSPSVIGWGPRVIGPKDRSSIHFMRGERSWGFVPQILVNEFQLASQNRLEATFRRMLLFGPSGRNYENPYIEILLSFPDRPTFDCQIATESKINDKPYSRSWEDAIDWHAPDGTQIRCVREEQFGENCYKLWIDLPLGTPLAKSPFKTAHAIRDALSILTSQTVQLLMFSIHRRDRRIEEIRVADDEHTRLGLWALLEQDSMKICGADLYRLAQYIVDGEHGEVCRRIYLQLTEATKQQTASARELLCATILEAALRTVNNEPFVPGGGFYPVEKKLIAFIETYFDSNWSGVANQIEKARVLLRHRNAHPDWLVSMGGSASLEKYTEALNSSILLSRFYGYMILALAGWKNLKPEFPKPVSH